MSDTRVFYQSAFAPGQPVVLHDEPYFAFQISWNVADMEWPPGCYPAPELKEKMRLEIRTKDGWREATADEQNMMEAKEPRIFRWCWDE
jgi:hypothetical protein